MTAPLYNSAILRLAAEIPHHARLPAPHGTADRRSPICGSRVTIDVALDEGGRIAALGAEVRACALGQASASLMMAHAIGRTPGEVARARDALAGFLSGERDTLGDWPGLEVLAAARDYPARHPSIRLAFEAAADAAERAVQRAHA